MAWSISHPAFGKKLVGEPCHRPGYIKTADRTTVTLNIFFFIEFLILEIFNFWSLLSYKKKGRKCSPIMMTPRAAVYQLLLIRYVLTCLQVTFCRTVLTDQIDHVSYTGMMGSDTTVHALWAHQCGSWKLF